MGIIYGALCLLSAQLFVDLVIAAETTEPQPVSRSSGQSLLHGLLHGGLAWLLLADGSAWLLALWVFMSHLLLDWLEARVQVRGLAGFLGGQVAHLAASMAGMLALIGWEMTSIQPFWTEVLGSWPLPVLLVVGGGLAAIYLGAEVVGGLVSPLRAQFERRPDRPLTDPGDPSDHADRGFTEGGRLIGMLERALIFLLVLMGQGGAIGFLVAAKSIFRFGELRQRSNRLEAEYILIGTLASFLWGLVMAALTSLALSSL